MGGTTTRARGKLAKDQPSETVADDPTVTKNKTQQVESPATTESKLEKILIAEQRKHAGDIGMLVQKSSVLEERAFHTAATLKILQQEMKELYQHVNGLEEKLHDARFRLSEAERINRKMEDSLRAKTRETIEQIKTHVIRQQDEDHEQRSANVGRLVTMRAESMVSDIDEARSEISSTVEQSTIAPSTVAPSTVASSSCVRYAHSSAESARAAAKHWRILR